VSPEEDQGWSAGDPPQSGGIAVVKESNRGDSLCLPDAQLMKSSLFSFLSEQAEPGGQRRLWSPGSDDLVDPGR
jgi:hypothetical protein